MPYYIYRHIHIILYTYYVKTLYEYVDRCRESGELPYQLTQFKKYYRDWVLQTRATMHINHKPGEIMEVYSTPPNLRIRRGPRDWAGTTAKLVDTDTGGEIDAYLYVAVLPYSTFAYTEAFLTMDQSAWTAGHVNAYEYFGGVTRILVPDNLKTGVINHGKTETVLNKAYHELAEHYGTAILPARVRSPKDKATVESTVGTVTTFILAAIRNQRFFTLAELNSAIRERLHQFNHKPFQKKEGSRATAFAEEKPFLLPLPKDRFELSEWKQAKVGLNYHISADHQNYSVPHEYIGQTVGIRLTKDVVEVFYEGSRIASHVRLYGRSEQYSTNESHMPTSHREYTQWNAQRFRDWSQQIGGYTASVIEAVFDGVKVEQQAYKTCMSILKLSDTYTPARLEAACAKALTYTPRPSYKAIQTILKSGQDKLPDEPAKPSNAAQHGFVRGSGYYGNGGQK
jgi:transposase